MATGVQPVPPAVSNVPEAPLNGYVMHFNSAIGEEYLKCCFVFKHIVYCPHHHFPIQIGFSPHPFQRLHDSGYDFPAIP